jgi:hypothetical protein
MDNFKAIWHLGCGLRLEWYTMMPERLWLFIPEIGMFPFAGNIGVACEWYDLPVWL